MRRAHPTRIAQPQFQTRELSPRNRRKDRSRKERGSGDGCDESFLFFPTQASEFPRLQDLADVYPFVRIPFQPSAFPPDPLSIAFRTPPLHSNSTRMDTFHVFGPIAAGDVFSAGPTIPPLTSCCGRRQLALHTPLQRPLQLASDTRMRRLLQLASDTRLRRCLR